jgi:hypothetical protein
MTVKDVVGHFEIHWVGEDGKGSIDDRFDFWCVRQFVDARVDFSPLKEREVVSFPNQAVRP